VFINGLLPTCDLLLWIDGDAASVDPTMRITGSFAFDDRVARLREAVASTILQPTRIGMHPIGPG
jgi:hypothetical protein